MKTIERKTRYSLDDYKAMLCREGYKYVDSGCYGAVYVNGNVAIKVGLTRRNKAYLDWVKFAIENYGSGNPWLPKIYELTKYECHSDSYDRDDFFVVCMEALSPLCWENPEQTELIEAARNFLYWNRSERLEKVVLTLKQGGFKDVLMEVSKISKAGHGIDMHMGNVMIRSETGEYVITDPLC